MTSPDYKRGYAAGYRAAWIAAGLHSRDCANCGEPFTPKRADARTCSPACRMALHRNGGRPTPRATSDRKRRTTAARRAARTRKRNQRDLALIKAYGERFEGFSGFIGNDVLRAMRVALKTGEDQPLLIEIRETNRRNAAEYDARHAAELAAERATPFDAKLERHYTARVKGRQLIEGDCDRRWPDYFAFREAHASDVEKLTDDDWRYLGQWTACPVLSRETVKRRKRAA